MLNAQAWQTTVTEMAQTNLPTHFPNRDDVPTRSSPSSLDIASPRATSFLKQSVARFD